MGISVSLAENLGMTSYKIYTLLVMLKEIIEIILKLRLNY